MSLRWRRNSRNAPKQTIDFDSASGSPPNNVLVTKADGPSHSRGFDAVVPHVGPIRESSHEPVARRANNLHREFSMAAEAAITAIGETSAKFSQITLPIVSQNNGGLRPYTKLNSHMRLRREIFRRLLLRASGYTRKSLAATPRHLHQSTIRLT